jgi:hypothetical protein
MSGHQLSNTNENATVAQIVKSYHKAPVKKNGLHSLPDASENQR